MAKLTAWQRVKRAMGFGKTQQRSAFAGAVTSRLNDFVFASIQSANQELRYEATVLRGRSRELARNNPTIVRFLRLLDQNVVGPHGIRLECQAVLKTGPNANTPDEVANDRVEAAWSDWGRKGQCDVTRKHSWRSFQSLALRTVARDGEAFVRIVEGFPNAYGFAVQLLDADQVDSNYSVNGANGEARIEQGIELDKWGAAVAFHVLTAHPGDAVRERTRERIPAAEILHLYRVDREGQARGIPWVAPVTVAARMLDGYTEAELVAARTGAAKMGWIQQGEDADGPDPSTPRRTPVSSVASRRARRSTNGTRRTRPATSSRSSSPSSA
jgi:lambda family phage portal protein